MAAQQQQPAAEGSSGQLSQDVSSEMQAVKHAREGRVAWAGSTGSLGRFQDGKRRATRLQQARTTCHCIVASMRYALQLSAARSRQVRTARNRCHAGAQYGSNEAGNDLELRSVPSRTIWNSKASWPKSSRSLGVVIVVQSSRTPPVLPAECSPAANACVCE